MVNTLYKSGQKPLFVFPEVCMETKQLKQLLEVKVGELGFTLESFSFANQQGQAVLTLVIDRYEEIDMETIVNLTHAINDYLDELNPFDVPYTLDISSLGAEKPLKINDLPKYVGKYVNVHLINPINGENIYQGDLLAVTDDQLVVAIKIKNRVKNIEISISNIYKIRLAIKF